MSWWKKKTLEKQKPKENSQLSKRIPSTYKTSQKTWILGLKTKSNTPSPGKSFHWCWNNKRTNCQKVHNWWQKGQRWEYNEWYKVWIIFYLVSKMKLYFCNSRPISWTYNHLVTKYCRLLHHLLLSSFIFSGFYVHFINTLKICAWYRIYCV